MMLSAAAAEDELEAALPVPDTAEEAAAETDEAAPDAEALAPVPVPVPVTVAAAEETELPKLLEPEPEPVAAGVPPEVE